MQPENVEKHRHYEIIARAIRFILAHARQQPTLEQIAQAVHLSPHHLQRVFAEWAGISPKRFLQFLTKEYAKQRLMAAGDMLTVAGQAGLSSTSRLHDLMVSCEAMTPGEIKSGGLGLEIGYGFAVSPFGEALLAWTTRGVCHFAFSIAPPAAMIGELIAYWPNAQFTRDDPAAMRLLAGIFPSKPTRGRVHLVLRGTNFQIKVWQALIQTEFGRVISYQQLAAYAGSPRAQRAVGSALAANHIGYLIPCHRVIRESGDSGHYRWQPERKIALLAWEAGQSEPVKVCASIPR